MRRTALALSVLGVWMIVGLGVAAATPPPVPPTPPEPRGAHPRMLLDAELRAAWKAEARSGRGPVPAAIRLCADAAGGARKAALYQGAAWSSALQACLVAWVATEQPEHARTAIRFFTALLDDLEQLGDGAGGDRSGERDSGYAIRNLGPFTAIAYDWLHDHPAMTKELRARARARWAAWLGWYAKNGYRARNAGTNYHAGYLAAATLIAIAQGGEAGEEGGLLWKLVADELWGKDMAAALATGGILDGGDWPEGWQYGPLAVANYALAARVARRAGITVEGVEPWLAGVLRRHVYALTPAERMYVGQDSESETANVEPHVLTLAAVALGDASADDRRWARGELARLGIADVEMLFYDALGIAGEKGAPAPRAGWPTWYIARATGTVFARTRWDERAVWFVAECQHALDVDHRQPKAGNFVLSRGRDDAIVDPSPYGSLSTLTSNAPTVASAQLPGAYQPSQGPWSERTAWDWTTQTRTGVVALRCDYSDQYRFQHRRSDVPDAMRDLVLLPSADGTDAVLVVVDRATTGGDDRALYLRFRTPGKLALAGDVATATIGRTHLAIAGVARSSGAPALNRPAATDCFKGEPPRGKCDAARFPVSEYRVELAGPEPRAVHAISATGGTAAKVAPVRGDGWAGVRIGGVRDAIVVWPRTPGRTLEYRAPRGAALTHVILDAPAAAGKATVAARADGDDCVVKVSAGGDLPARPAIVVVDDACAVALDPEAASALAGAIKPAAPNTGRARRSGCCSAQPPGAEALLAVVVLALLVAPRLRRTSRSRSSRSRRPAPARSRSPRGTARAGSA